MNTTQYPITADQLRARLEGILYQLDSQCSDIVKSYVYGALAQKQEAFSGQAYLDQLEKNVIYMDVLAMRFRIVTAKYLCMGEPILSLQEIEPYVKSTCVKPALGASFLHLKFIREGCPGCDVHFHHGRYSWMLELRQSGDWSKYLEKLERSYIGSQAVKRVAEILLRVLLENHQFSGMARNIPYRETLDVIDNRTRIRASIWLDAITWLE
jgi:hypothetical protein